VTFFAVPSITVLFPLVKSSNSRLLVPDPLLKAKTPIVFITRLLLCSLSDDIIKEGDKHTDRKGRGDAEDPASKGCSK
jgi:hypothetical protein